MDVLTEQVISLTHKVDALYEVVMQLQEKNAIDHQLIYESFSWVSPPEVDIVDIEDPHVLTDKKSAKDRQHNHGKFYSFSSESMPPQLGDSIDKHKDILSDDCYMNGITVVPEEAMLTVDVQIQRLTAQLTAAYNRIAALEEQLLSKRVRA